MVAAAREAGRRAESFGADVTDPADAARLVEEVVATFGAIDVLVNSAAVFIRSPFLDATDDEFEAAWKQSFETNLLAPARLARAAAPVLKARRGAIVNIIDVGATRAWPSYAHHTAAKAGLAHLTRTLSVALGPEVRVNGVSPGIAMFPDDMPEHQRNALIQKTALERPGTADDIGAAVVFLASQPYITGAILPVDGGWGVGD